LDEVIAEYRIDEQRIYLTGLSMGGFGTWRLAMAYPDRFAALAPVCGGGDPDQAHLVAHLPTWVFHGAKDDVVSIENSKKMVAALKKAGCDVKFTIYPDAGHDSWTETYNNPELYDWFLDHSIKQRRLG
jgi:predicted peptidase